MKHSYRFAVALIAGTALWSGLALHAHADGQLTIMATGGAWQDAQRHAWFEPFAKEAGIQLNEQEYLGDLGKIRAMVETGDVPVDLVTVETATVLQGCDSGILEHLDYSKIGDRSKFLPGTALDCGVGLDVYGDVLAYDSTVLKDGPTSVLDIFDTKKFPGKRAMRKFPAQNLEWALMADGVPTSDVYKVLATPEGVDRAFKKLDTIKKDIVWWDAGAQPPQLLASHEVVMTTAWNGRIQTPIDTDHKPFVIVWKDQIVEYDMISIPKGAKNTDLAYKYLAYISKPENAARLGQYIPYGPVRTDATSFVPQDVLPKLPTAPDHMKSYLVGDVEFWGDYGEDLTKRFNAWLAQ
jgi:putative spermidine/putrescine transport system substrate-binding protein